MPIELPQSIETFDGFINAKWQPLRSSHFLQRIALTASEVGDFGVVWMVIAALPALTGSPRHGKALVRMGCALALESLIVNQGLKRLFKRQRPLRDVDRSHAIRQPSTSSFPSGHSTSALTAAVLLSETSPVPGPLLWTAAGVVAASRVHVQMHHPSDVLSGAVVGLGVGYVIRRIFKV